MVATLAIRAARLIDGTGRPPLNDAVLLIEGQRIAALGPWGAVSLPRETPLLERKGETLLPGLVDAHSHICVEMTDPNVRSHLNDPPVKRTLRAAHLMQLDLQAGITTIRVMGERDGVDLACREAVQAGMLCGPRLRVAGAGIMPSHGHGGGIPADGVDAVRAAVRTNVRAGADHIKLFVGGGAFSPHTKPTDCFYSPEEITAAVEEAHRSGRLVGVHLHGGPGVTSCLQADVDAIEHGGCLTDADIECMLARKTWLVATLGALYHPEALGRRGAAHASIQAKVDAMRAQAGPTVVRAARAGVRLAVGTDAMHKKLAYEVKCLVDFGLPVMDALVAATRGGAELCGLGDECGTLEPGKLADVITVSGNPLMDVTALNRVGLVMQAGEVCQKTEGAAA